MFCLFENGPCISFLWLGISVVVILLIVLALIWETIRHFNNSENMISQPSGRDEDSEPDRSDDSKPTITVGQKFAYGEEADSPIFQVTDVDEDENEIRGIAIFPLPAGSKDIDIDEDPDNLDNYTVEYTMPDGTFVRDPWDLSNAPDALSDWNVIIVKQIADPADIEIK